MRITVETRYGRIRGTRDRGVHCFRGIPFAHVPTGERRFLRPEPPLPWDDVLDASSYGPPAPQADAPDADEDCLHLNVWTPSPDGLPRPVVVWIHDGDFVAGRASLPETSGHALARRGDSVVVTLHYRLGALGFLDLRPHGLGCNVGLLDQVAALEWVRDEIDVFGGDPQAVMLVGTGAGATSIIALLASPRAAGLFRRAVVQNGSYALADPETAGAAARTFLWAVGEAGPEPKRLQDLPLARVLEGQRRALERAASLGIRRPFGPVIDGDLIPLPPLEALRGGSGRGVPLLVGASMDAGPTAAEQAARLLDTQSGHEPRVYAYVPLLGANAAPIIFGTYADAGVKVDLPPELDPAELLDWVQDAGLAFAHSGDPSHLGTIAWPRYAPPERVAMVFTDERLARSGALQDSRLFPGIADR